MLLNESTEALLVDRTVPLSALGEGISTEDPQLADVQRPEYNINSAIMVELVEGKLSLDVIAKEHFVAEAHIEAVRDKLLETLGCNGAVLPERKRIIKAIINDRLTTGRAAEVFDKYPSAISRLKKQIYDKIAKIEQGGGC